MKPYQNQEFEDTEVSNVYSMYEPMMQPEIVSFNPDDVTRTEFNSQHNKGLLRHMSDNDLYHQMKFSQSEASQRLGVR